LSVKARTSFPSAPGGDGSRPFVFIDSLRPVEISKHYKSRALLGQDQLRFDSVLPHRAVETATRDYGANVPNDPPQQPPNFGGRTRLARATTHADFGDVMRLMAAAPNQFESNGCQTIPQRLLHHRPPIRWTRIFHYELPDMSAVLPRFWLIENEPAHARAEPVGKLGLRQRLTSCISGRHAEIVYRKRDQYQPV
jgi:hypothetical protein